MICIYSGLPGAGKSAKLARQSLYLLQRNERWHKKTGQRRVVWSNLKFSPAVERRYAGFVQYWTDLRQLEPLRDVDVVIDEVGTYFDSRLWETLSLSMRRWINQHRKFGIEIYGTAQDFAQVDKAFRRCTSDLLYIVKVFGTRDISPTRPPPRFVFVLSLVKTLDPTRYDEDISKFQGTSMLPAFMLLTRDDVEVFDTRAEVALSKALPLKHIQRVCEDPACGFCKIQHV